MKIKSLIMSALLIFGANPSSLHGTAVYSGQPLPQIQTGSRAVFLGFPRSANQKHAQIKVILTNHGGQTINWIEIRNADLPTGGWNTDPRNSSTPIMLAKDQTQLNNKTPLRLFVIPGESFIFDLYVQDNGSFKEGHAHNLVSLGFEDGETTSLPIQHVQP